VMSLPTGLENHGGLRWLCQLSRCAGATFALEQISNGNEPVQIAGRVNSLPGFPGALKVTHHATEAPILNRWQQSAFGWDEPQFYGEELARAVYLRTSRFGFRGLLGERLVDSASVQTSGSFETWEAG
jgi:hypothetical protein